MNYEHSSGEAEWLNNEDSVCFDQRLTRLNRLATITPIEGYVAFPGGLVAKSLFEETRYCFVYGQFLATVYLGFAYIERTLAALFYEAGRSDLERANISTLLSEALAYGVLDEDEFRALEGIRKMRNVYAHFREPGSKESVEYRAYLDDVFPYAVIERDAATVVTASIRMVTRNAL